MKFSYKFNSVFIKFIFFLSTIIAITPAITPYYYDIPSALIFVFLLIQFFFGGIKKDLFYLLLVILLFLILQITLDIFEVSSYQGLKRLLADLRFFFYFFFAIYIFDKGIEISKYIIFAFLIIIFVNMIFLIIGIYEPNIYKDAIMLYQGNHYSIYSLGKPLSLQAYMGEKIIGLFLAPIFLGIFFLILSYMTFICFRFLKMSFKTMFVTQLLSIFFLTFGGTSLIWLYPLSFFFFFYFEKKITIKLVLIFLTLSILFYFILFYDNLNLLINHTLLGGRFYNYKGEEGNILQAWNRIDLSLLDLLFGFSPVAKGELGKGFGDMGYLIRFVYGGIIYTILYYFSIFYCFIKKFNKISYIWLPIFLIGLIVNIGGVFFTIPQFGWLLIISFVIMLKKIDQLFIYSR